VKPGHERRKPQAAGRWGRGCGPGAGGGVRSPWYRQGCARRSAGLAAMRGTRDQHQQSRVPLVQQLTHPASSPLVDCIAGFQVTGLKRW